MTRRQRSLPDDIAGGFDLFRERLIDERAAAAGAADADRYRAAVRLAQGQQITEEQQRDAYHWGRQGAARTFDWRGE